VKRAKSDSEIDVKELYYDLYEQVAILENFLKGLIYYFA
jgi:hypothetical protein